MLRILLPALSLLAAASRLGALSAKVGSMPAVTGCANTGDPEDGWSYDAPADCTDLEIDEPSAEAPEGTVATMSILSHWSAASGGGQERTVKATIHLAE